MDLETLGTEIAKIGLPLLGAIIPIPGGAAIGTALASCIGASSSKPEDILTALTSSADAVEKAKEFQTTHTETMLQLHQNYALQLYQAEVSDRSSARLMQTSTKSYTLPILSWLVIGGFIAVIVLKMLGHIAQGDQTTGDLVTTLRDAVILVLSFYYGTSQGSQDKNILLAQSTPPKPY